MMPNLHIVTNEEQIWFGNSQYVNKTPHTRFCIEQVSSEMYEALLHLGGQPEHSRTISFLLYNILDRKSLSNN